MRRMLRRHLLTSLFALSVVAVSCGLLKKRSILGAMRGGWISVLATDDATAQAVLEEARKG